MGTHPGAGPEQGVEAEAEPPEATAVQLGPQQHLGLAGRDGGGTGTAPTSGAQHRHLHHRAPNQETQGNCLKHLLRGVPTSAPAGLSQQ